MNRWSLELRSTGGFLTFLALFLAILTLFVLLAYHVPEAREVGPLGWVWLILFLFIFFVGEPVYRRMTDRFEYHILLLEIYLFGAYFIQLFFALPQYGHLFYVIPIFSAALSFGLTGTMLTALAVFCLEVFTVTSPLDFQFQAITAILPDVLPLAILSLLLGFTVELKDYTQRQLLNRLSKMNAFRSLKNVVEAGRRELPFTEKLLENIVRLTDARGGFIYRPAEEKYLEIYNLSLEICEEIRKLKENAEGQTYYRRGEIYRIKLPWAGEEFELYLLGDTLQGIMSAAERQMVSALETYLQHFVDYLRVQHEKNRSYQLLETLIETVPPAILVLNEEGRVVRHNSSAEELLKRDLLEDRLVKELLNTKEEFELKSCRKEITLRRGEEDIPVDLAINRTSRSGEQYWVMVMSDLSPLRELQQEAERRRRLLALGEMAAGLAHEIRNPLGSLSGFVSLLDEKLEEIDDEKRKLIKKIRRSYRKIDNMISRFVQYAEKPVLESRDFDPIDTCWEIIDELELPEKIDLDLDIGLEEKIELNGDPNRFRMALRNILQNAVEACSNGDEIDLKLQKTNAGQLLIEFADTGEGIEKEKQEEIFDPFYSTREEGMGLGLSLAHRVVEDEFEGRLTLESTPGKGTKVTAQIPL